MSYLQNPGYVRVAFVARMHGRPWSAGAAWQAWYDIRLQAADMVAGQVADGGDATSSPDLELWKACERRMAVLRAKKIAEESE